MNTTKSYLSLTVFVILAYIASSTSDTNAQEFDRQKFTEIIIAEIKKNKGRTLGLSPSKIFHVYSVEIPEDAVIIQREKNFNYEIYPVYITTAYRESFYRVSKKRIPYEAVIYNKPKNSYASLSDETPKADDYEKITYWTYEEQTKDFKKTLDEFKNLSNTNLEELFGTEDKLPSHWKK
ncbi:MAG: hypothetical protein N2510_06250 [Ignavibacteria bacterium]|nr:hypothetical protein [Ignavibacteria bacterium]